MRPVRIASRVRGVGGAFRAAIRGFVRTNALTEFVQKVQPRLKSRFQKITLPG
jgi:hypothetical protein